MSNILKQVRRAARERILFLPHALDRMNVPDRMITPGEVRNVIFHGEIIEDYPEDVRGHSCLMLGRGEGERWNASTVTGRLSAAIPVTRPIAKDII